VILPGDFRFAASPNCRKLLAFEGLDYVSGILTPRLGNNSLLTPFPFSSLQWPRILVKEFKSSSDFDGIGKT
jgi:hypothetical protein